MEKNLADKNRTNYIALIDNHRFTMFVAHMLFSERVDGIHCRIDTSYRIRVFDGFSKMNSNIDIKRKYIERINNVLGTDLDIENSMPVAMLYGGSYLLPSDIWAFKDDLIRNHSREIFNAGFGKVVNHKGKKSR